MNNCLVLETVVGIRLRRFSGLFWPFFDPISVVNIRQFDIDHRNRIEKRLKRTQKSTEANFDNSLLKVLKMKTTIAELDIEAHVRWAKDQDYDTKYITESHLVAPHPEILGVSSIYASKFEELFELQRRNMPWAAFAPPKNFHLFSKRFFSYRLFYGFKPFVDEEEEGEKSASSLEEILNVQPQKHLSKHAFEKEKTAISDLLKSIHWINHLLGFVSSRKLQFQKG